MEKNRLKDIKEIIISFLLAIVFIFSQIFAYYQGVIFGADNHEIVEEVKDDVFNKKESNRRYSRGGITVPDSGYVEKVYFNTSLLNEDIRVICSQLTFFDFDGLNVYPIFSNNTGTNTLFIIQHFDDYEIYWCSNITDISSANLIMSTYDFEIEWLYSEWSLNDNGVNSLQGLPIGSQNVLIKNLVSLVPFPSDGVSSVPNWGYVENVYLNINLSIDEVKYLLNNLNYISLSDNDLAYFVLSLGDMFESIVIQTTNDKTDFIIASNLGSSVIYCFSTTSNVGFVGWNPDFDGIISVNSNVINVIDNDVFLGLENYELKDLFSITPFVEEDKPLFFEQFIEDASDIVLGFLTILVNATVSLTDIMYNESTNQLTIVGSAFALALAVGVVYLFFRLIRGLIRSNNRG